MVVEAVITALFLDCGAGAEEEEDLELAAVSRPTELCGKLVQVTLNPTVVKLLQEDIRHEVLGASQLPIHQAPVLRYADDTPKGCPGVSAEATPEAAASVARYAPSSPEEGLVASPAGAEDEYEGDFEEDIVEDEIDEGICGGFEREPTPDMLLMPRRQHAGAAEVDTEAEAVSPSAPLETMENMAAPFSPSAGPSEGTEEEEGGICKGLPLRETTPEMRFLSTIHPHEQNHQDRIDSLVSRYADSSAENSPVVSRCLPEDLSRARRGGEGGAPAAAASSSPQQVEKDRAAGVMSHAISTKSIEALTEHSPVQTPPPETCDANAPLQDVLGSSSKVEPLGAQHILVREQPPVFARPPAHSKAGRDHKAEAVDPCPVGSVYMTPMESSDEHNDYGSVDEGSWDKCSDEVHGDGVLLESEGAGGASAAVGNAPIRFSDWLKAAGALEDDSPAEEGSGDEDSLSLPAAPAGKVPFSEWMKLQSEGEDGREEQVEEEEAVVVEPMPRQAIPYSEWLKAQQ